MRHFAAAAATAVDGDGGDQSPDAYNIDKLCESESVDERVARPLFVVYHSGSTFMDIIRSFMSLDVQFLSPPSYAWINNIFCGDVDSAAARVQREKNFL